MKILLIIFGFALIATVEAAKSCEPKRYSVVCYLASWSVYRDGKGAFKINYILPNYCTHLIYTFAGLNLAGGVDSLDYFNDINVNKGYEKIVQLKEENPCLKVILAIGGWNEGSEKYSLMAESEETRNAFADHALRFLVQYGFDGLDVDWEYPTMRGGLPEDRENFVLLLEALHTKFEHRKKLLTIAMSGSTSVIQEAYNLTAICEILDFINLMGYDYSVRQKTSVDAPLYSDTTTKSESVDSAISFIRKSGCPLSKIHLGISTMAKTYTLKPEAVNRVSPGSDVKGPGRAGPFTKSAGVLGYNELCQMLMDSKWTVKPMRNVGVKIAALDDQWVTFDDRETVAEKAQYVKSKGLGGVMFWTVDTDDFHGDCHNEAYPLLAAANRVLK
ncbi:probable chitinase 2 [Malaya genurostris]|uniref:probable chitinase 2 n=1 Tax=Malaya genurostris TaxID=325434 RepID=UPI0026F3B416|nr:probable chitinase 2 [Malaya genurostris]